MNKENRPKCAECGSKLVYLRISKRELVCRSCGHIQKMEEKEQ